MMNILKIKVQKKRFGPFHFGFITCLLFLLIGCDIFNKTGLPEDHGNVMEGIHHGEDADEPFDDDEEGCSSSSCHQRDLKGGISDVDGKPAIAPSCFQCHGKLWKGKGR